MAKNTVLPTPTMKKPKEMKPTLVRKGELSKSKASEATMTPKVKTSLSKPKMK